MTLDEFKKLSSDEMSKRINWVQAATRELTADEQAFIDAYEAQVLVENPPKTREQSNFDPSKLKFGPRIW